MKNKTCLNINCPERTGGKCTAEIKDKPNPHAQEMGRLSVKSRKAKLGKAFNDRMTYISSLAVAARKKKKELSPDTLATERLIG